MSTPEKHFVMLDLPLEHTLQPVSVFQYPGSEFPATTELPVTPEQNIESENEKAIGWARFTVIQGL